MGRFGPSKQKAIEERALKKKAAVELKKSFIKPTVFKKVKKIANNNNNNNNNNTIEKLKVSIPTTIPEGFTTKTILRKKINDSQISKDDNNTTTTTTTIATSTNMIAKPISTGFQSVNFRMKHGSLSSRRSSQKMSRRRNKSLNFIEEIQSKHNAWHYSDDDDNNNNDDDHGDDNNINNDNNTNESTTIQYWPDPDSHLIPITTQTKLEEQSKNLTPEDIINSKPIYKKCVRKKLLEDAKQLDDLFLNNKAFNQNPKQYLLSKWKRDSESNNQNDSINKNNSTATPMEGVKDHSNTNEKWVRPHKQEIMNANNTKIKYENRNKKKRNNRKKNKNQHEKKSEPNKISTVQFKKKNRINSKKNKNKKTNDRSSIKI